jgi:hypothetical protein
MQAAIRIPEPSESDPDDVATALETAALLVAKGELTEALRWVRRGAESASETGDDMRALALARAAAELMDQLEHQSPIRPSGFAPVSPAKPVTAQEPVSPPHAPKEAIAPPPAEASAPAHSSVVAAPAPPAIPRDAATLSDPSAEQGLPTKPQVRPVVSIPAFVPSTGFTVARQIKPYVASAPRPASTASEAPTAPPPAGHDPIGVPGTSPRFAKTLIGPAVTAAAASAVAAAPTDASASENPAQLPADSTATTDAWSALDAAAALREDAFAPIASGAVEPAPVVAVEPAPVVAVESAVPAEVNRTDVPVSPAKPPKPASPRLGAAAAQEPATAQEPAPAVEADPASAVVRAAVPAAVEEHVPPVLRADAPVRAEYDSSVPPAPARAEYHSSAPPAPASSFPSAASDSAWPPAPTSSFPPPAGESARLSSSHPPPASEPARPRMALRKAARVAVRAAGGTQYVVRTLEEDEELDHGEQEGLLVLLEPRTRLF